MVKPARAVLKMGMLAEIGEEMAPPAERLTSKVAPRLFEVVTEAWKPLDRDSVMSAFRVPWVLQVEHEMARLTPSMVVL